MIGSSNTEQGYFNPRSEKELNNLLKIKLAQVFTVTAMPKKKKKK